MKREYIPKRFSKQRQWLITHANQIIDEYQAQGYSLTLRQLYYQFVARDLIPNTQAEYKKLQSTINDARLAGLVDWYALEDRTRNLVTNSNWDSPKQILEAARDSYSRSMWEDQPNYVEVWIEKDALIGVIESVCSELDVPYFSCRGYASQSEVWRAGMRMARACGKGKKVTLIHLGDHDPSGIDMTLDIWKRLNLFTEDYYDTWAELSEHYGRSWAMEMSSFYQRGNDNEAGVNVERIALNMDQVKQYRPPPNYAKLTDSRIGNYRDAFGSSSWELDALDPSTINTLVRDEVEDHIDQDIWDKTVKRQEKERKQISKLINQL